MGMNLIIEAERKPLADSEAREGHQEKSCGQTTLKADLTAYLLLKDLHLIFMV